MNDSSASHEKRLFKKSHAAVNTVLIDGGPPQDLYWENRSFIKR